MRKTYVIIGTSAAGIGVAYTLRMLDSQARIICLSAEPEEPYNKCVIVDYLTDKKDKAELFTLTADIAHAKRIERYLNWRVNAIDVAKKIIGSDNGFLSPSSLVHAISYDSLCIATGCSPRMPSEITTLQYSIGIFSFYSLSDVEAIRAYIKNNTVKTAIIIGA